MTKPMTGEVESYVPFSVRATISRAIADPGLLLPRIVTKDGMVETLSHWQARAALEAMFKAVESSPTFADAIRSRANL